MEMPRTLRVAAAISAILVAAAPAASAAVVPCSLAIDVGAGVPLAWSEAAHQTFRREATRIWSAEGVRFCWTGDGPCPPRSATLLVRVVREAPVVPDGGPGRALGWMGFSGQSGPGPLIPLSERWTADLRGAPSAAPACWRACRAWCRDCCPGRWVARSRTSWGTTCSAGASRAAAA